MHPTAFAPSHTCSPLPLLPPPPRAPLPLLPPPLLQEYADFIKQVEVDSAAAAAQQAAEEEAAAAGRLDREDFEQL